MLFNIASYTCRVIAIARYIVTYLSFRLKGVKVDVTEFIKNYIGYQSIARVLITLCTQTNDVNGLKFGIVVWVLHHGVLVFITVISSYQNSVMQRQLM